jgi:hypothetical protein
LEKACEEGFETAGNDFLKTSIVARTMYYLEYHMIQVLVVCICLKQISQQTPDSDGDAINMSIILCAVVCIHILSLSRVCCLYAYAYISIYADTRCGLLY